MTLAASEDKTHRGAYVASPSMPWAFGQGLEKPSSVYHLVWSRDLYQIATGLLAAGDSAGPGRSLDFLFDKQQTPDGCFPQNSNLDGSKRWENLQLDEVALPVVLAWQLGRRDAKTFASVKRAVGCILEKGPQTPQERWENQSGWSPATIASEIAALVCAADLARANGDPASAAAWEAKADDWQSKVDGWTATSNGPYSPAPYYLRLSKHGDPNEGTTYDIGDSGPTKVDQRKVTDPSFLELVRLGVKRADHPHRAEHARRRRPPPRRRHPARPLLAPLRLRRLRREARRLALGRRSADQPDRGLGEEQDDRADLADLRGRARRVRAGGRPVGRGARAAGRDGARRRRRAT